MRTLIHDQQRVDTWNARHPVGTPVVVRKVLGGSVRTVTTTPASLLGGHNAIVWVDDSTGCYPLDAVEYEEPQGEQGQES